MPNYKIQGIVKSYDYLWPSADGLAAGPDVRLLRAGEPVRAITVVETCMRHDPFCSPWALGQLGLAHYILKEYSNALPALRKLASRLPNMRQAHVWLAANLAKLGQMNDA